MTHVLLKCSLLSNADFKLLSQTERKWLCSSCIAETLPFHNVDNTDIFLGNLGIDYDNHPNLSIISRSSNDFVNECQNLSNLSNSVNILQDEEDELYTQINSQYLSISELNQINHNHDLSFKLLHTNLASISKHCDDLQLTLSLLKTKFDIIGISEHKIQKGNDASISNIDIPGFHPFVFDCSDTTHGGTGLYIKNLIVYNKWDDLKLYSSGHFESTLKSSFLTKRIWLYL